METCWPPTASSRLSTPNSTPSRATLAPTSVARCSSTSAAAGGCWASTATAPGLIMPALSAAISATVLPRYLVWSRDIGVTTATAPSATFVLSQVPPMPTSSTQTSTGASANTEKAIPTSTSKNDNGTSWVASTMSTYGLISS